MERNHSRRVSQFTFIAIPYFSKLVLESILWWTGKRRVWVRRGFARRSWNGKITKHRRCTNYELNNGRNVTLPRRSRISRSARVFLIPRATSRDIRRPCSSAFTESAPCTASGGEQPRREASEFLLFSVPRRNSFLPSSPPWLEKGGGCSLKNERGPLVCPRFIFISFLPSPPFSRAPRKIICHRLPTILCLDTWTRGRRVGKRLDGGKEVNNVTDVQDFHCEISPFLQCLPMKQNSVAEGLRRATEFSYRTFFPLFRSANFRCQNGLRLNEVWSTRERKREDFEFLNNSRWRCFGMSTILKFFETCNEMLSC